MRYLLLFFVISFIIRGAEYPCIWDQLFCGPERTTIRVLLTLFMNNTIGRQHTKAPLAALTTSSYELVIVCSIDLDPGSLLRQIGDDVIRPCKICGDACQDQFKSTKVCVRSATLSDWLIGYRFKFRPISWQSIIPWISHLGYKSKNFHSVLNLLLKFWWNFKLHQALLSTYYFISNLSV